MAVLSQLGIDTTCGLGTIEHLAANQQLITEGRATRRFLVVLSGSLDVSVEGVTLATLTAGECCGEIGLLSRLQTNDGRATATVVTSSDVTLLSFAPWEFKTMLDSYPIFLQTTNGLALDRLARGAAYSAHCGSKP